MQRLDLSIEGMGCGACVRKATAALQSVPGVSVQRVSVGSATVTFDPDAGASHHAADAAVRALAGAGYAATAKEVQHVRQ